MVELQEPARQGSSGLEANVLDARKEALPIPWEWVFSRGYYGNMSLPTTAQEVES